VYQYLKEWNEACAYAGECLPPFIYSFTKEPYVALGFVGAVCIAIYLWNEYSLVRGRS